MQFIPVRVKLNFQQPLLQSSVSHDTSEIIILCRFIVFFLIISVFSIANSSLFFVETRKNFQDFLMNRKF